MKQPYYKKVKALKLKNDGLNNVEISKLTGVSTKAIAKWIDNWKKADKVKNETILSIHNKIQELTKAKNETSFFGKKIEFNDKTNVLGFAKENESFNSSEILQLTQSIEILQSQLLLKSKLINL